jgi:hypothetical protein
MLGPDRRPSKDDPSPPIAGEGHTPQKADLREGLRIVRRFTEPGVHPYDEIEWELRDAVITNERGEVAFEQRNVEVPKTWSQLATNVVAQKYFRGPVGTPEREHSVRQLIDRVARTAARWGRDGGYFAGEEDAEAFEAELTYLLVRQMVSFNSPVWFNCGVEEHPQVSACFINSVDDTMGSILDLAKTEGMLFKFGSGTGSNLSPIRSSREQLAGGGTASGPVSFMKGYDAFAGVIKSGGKTRRAAKMVILDADHPDIVEFITCKADEEKKAWALIDAGYSGEFNVPGGAYDSVFFQNANHSVRVTDEFMRVVLNDGEWSTLAVTTGRPFQTYQARDLMRKMAEAAWVCGDPGIQFDTTINTWHTCPDTARINASNPCSEYMFLDDSACNLASLNLMRFRRADGEFDIETFRHAIEVTIAAMEIWVDNASYPTEPIRRNSHDYRPLGLGYANLGALLMSRGLSYDSDAGRGYAAALTALMCGQAYAASAKIAAKTGPFPGFERNREPFLRVMRRLVGRCGHARHRTRVPQCAGDRAGADGDDRLHDGLRHDRYRARPGAGQVQEAGRRRPVQDRQQQRAAGAAEAGARARRDPAHRGLRQRARHDRGLPGAGRRAPDRVRLRVQAGQRRALDPAHGPHQDDGGGSAVPVRSDLQDRQHAGLLDGRGHRGGLHRGLEAGSEVDRHLPRRLQADAAAEHRLGGRRRRDSGGGHDIGGAGAEEAARHATLADAQVLGRRPRRLHHRRSLRERPTG